MKKSARQATVSLPSQTKKHQYPTSINIQKLKGNKSNEKLGKIEVLDASPLKSSISTSRRSKEKNNLGPKKQSEKKLDTKSPIALKRSITASNSKSP